MSLTRFCSLLPPHKTICSGHLLQHSPGALSDAGHIETRRTPSLLVRVRQRCVWRHRGPGAEARSERGRSPCHVSAINRGLSSPSESQNSINLVLLFVTSSVFGTHDPWQAAIFQRDDMCEPGQRCQQPSTQQIVNVIGAVRSSLYLSLI